MATYYILQTVYDNSYHELFVVTVTCMWETYWRTRTVYDNVDGSTKNLSTKKITYHDCKNIITSFIHEYMCIDHL